MKSEAQSHAIRTSSTEMATYSYLAHFAFLSHTQGSALQGEKPMSNMMSWIFWDHIRRELFSPYSALYIANRCPSSSSNSGDTFLSMFRLCSCGTKPQRSENHHFVMTSSWEPQCHHDIIMRTPRITGKLKFSWSGGP